MYHGGLVRQRLLDGFSYQWCCRWLGLVLFAYACIRAQNIYELIKLVILAEAFIVGSQLTTLKWVFIGLGLGLWVNLAFNIHSGLFINTNTFAELCVIVIVGLFVYRVYWLIPGLLIPIIINGSRGAILTLCFMIFRWYSLLLLPLLIWFRPNTIYERLDIWRNTINHVTLFGYGIGSFQPYSYYNIYTRPTNAHNDLLQILFELGIVGAVLAVGFVWSVLWKSNEKERYILWSFLLISCFDFPLYLPVSASIAALVCGFLTRYRNDLFIHAN